MSISDVACWPLTHRLVDIKVSVALEGVADNVGGWNGDSAVGSKDCWVGATGGRRARPD